MLRYWVRILDSDKNSLLNSFVDEDFIKRKLSYMKAVRREIILIACNHNYIIKSKHHFIEETDIEKHGTKKDEWHSARSSPMLDYIERKKEVLQNNFIPKCKEENHIYIQEINILESFIDAIYQIDEYMDLLHILITLYEGEKIPRCELWNNVNHLDRSDIKKDSNLYLKYGRTFSEIISVNLQSIDTINAAVWEGNTNNSYFCDTIIFGKED